MKDEILFRGKRRHNGEWVFGDLNHIEGKVYIFSRNPDSFDSPNNYEIDPETVGQFSTIVDKKKEKISWKKLLSLKSILIAF